MIFVHDDNDDGDDDDYMMVVMMMMIMMIMMMVMMIIIVMILNRGTPKNFKSNHLIYFKIILDSYIHRKIDYFRTI